MKYADEYVLMARLATDSTVRCTIRRKNSTPRNGRAKTSVTWRSLKERQLRDVDAGVMAGHPYLYLEIVYGRDALGTTSDVGKFYVIRMLGAGVLCAYDRAGHDDAFRHLVSGIVESLEIDNGQPQEAPTYREVTVVSIAGKRVGFGLHMLFAGSADGTRSIDVDAMLTLRSWQDIVAHDAITTEEANAQGELVSGVYTSFEGSKREYELRLTRQDQLHYQISGLFRDKRIQAEARLERPFHGNASHERLIGKHLASTPSSTAELVLTEYVPTLDPTRLTAGILRYRGGSSELPYEWQVGNRKLRVAFDEHGSMRKGRGRVGALDFEIERIWSAGTPP